MKKENIRFEIWEEEDWSLWALIESKKDSIITTGNNITELIRNINEAIQTSNYFKPNQLNIIKALFNNKEYANKL